MNFNSAGFRYTKNLFYCVLLCYYDKFHNFDEMAVKKLFLWAFMLRVDMKSLRFDSINKYAIGDGTYTNKIAMFSKISFARVHKEISRLQIKVRKESEPGNEKWYNLLKKLMDIEVPNE